MQRRRAVHLRFRQRALRRPALVRSYALLPRYPGRLLRLAVAAAGRVLALPAVLLRRGAAGDDAGPGLADGRGLLPPRAVPEEVPGRLLRRGLDVWTHLLPAPDAGRRPLPL